MLIRPILDTIMTGPTIINYGTVNVNSGVSTTGGARGGRAGRGGRGGGGGKRGRGSGRLGGCAGVGPKNAPKVKKKTKTEEEKKRPAVSLGYSMENVQS